MFQKIRQAKQDISTQTLEKMWKDMNAKTSYVVGVNSGQFEQENIRMTLLVYFYYSA